MEQSNSFYKVGSFWRFVGRTIERDTELLLFFAIYTLLSVVPLPTFFYLLVLFKPHLASWYLAPLTLVWFANLFILRFFQFVVAYTFALRESGGRPTVGLAIRYALDNLPLIFKLVCCNFLLDIFLIGFGMLIDSIFKSAKPASCLLAKLVFGASDTAAQVVVGFLVPMAVCSREKDLRTLFKKTAKLIQDNFWGGLLISTKLGIVLSIILVPFLLSIVVLPDYMSQGPYKVTLIAEFYVMLLVAQSIGMCATLLYTKMVLLSTQDGLSATDLGAKVAELGVRLK
jgi:hypothetical protein